MAAVIATIDARLRNILAGNSSPAYLAKGSQYDNLPTMHSGCFPKGSRHDHLVAYLCNVGVRTVQSARQRAAAAASAHGQVAPRQSGVKRGAKVQEPEDEQEQPLPRRRAEGDVNTHVDEHMVSALQSAGYQTHHGVSGHFVQGSAINSANHAIALVLGRLYVYALLKNIPDSTVLGLLALFHLSGIDIGQRHHHEHVLSAYGGIVARMCLHAKAVQFGQKPTNLLHPSAWRLIFDGITLRNGATVTVVLICYTNRSGEIEVVYLGCARCGARSNAEASGKAILSVLEETLSISETNATCIQAPGLPLSQDVALGSSQGQRKVRRGMFLTSIPCDRAYCGRTGTGTDAWLSDKLGVRGLLGTARRVGMADLFHCYDGSARKIWRGKAKASGADDDDDDEASDVSSLTDDDTAETGATPLMEWVRVCRQLRGLLSRGHGNYHLANAYDTHEIYGRPKIMIPSATRMIVYSSAFLRQSFAHFPARYTAMCAYRSVLQALASDPSNKSRAAHRKRLAKVERVGSGLAQACRILPALLTHDCFSMKGGFIASALRVQESAQVFFPLHLVNRRVWWQLCHLGLLPTAAARLEARSLAPPQDHMAARVAGFRCRCCGLLRKTGGELVKHFRACHLHENGHPRRRNFTPDMFTHASEVLRPSHCFECSAPLRISADADIKQPILALAARQRDVKVSSIWEKEGLLRLLRTLLSYAVSPHDCAAVVASSRQAVVKVSPTLQDVFRWFLAALGSKACKPMWVSSRSYWSCCCSCIISGHWQKRNVEAFDSKEHTVQEALPSRSRAQAVAATDVAIAATQYVRRFFHTLSRNFEQDVIHSHGDHIPIRLRDSATVLFWLPEVLTDNQVRKPSEFSQEQLARYWSGKLRCMPVVLAYVANQISVYEWPSTDETMKQYKKLMTVWSNLLDQVGVKERAWKTSSRLVAEPKSDSFDWAWWWKMAHTDARWRPRGCEAILTMFHFTGMIGVSEARAESIGSLLKRYSPAVSARLSTDRIIEKTIIRASGIDGGTATDDLFLLRCWIEYFGGMQPDKFSFRFRNPKNRSRAFPLGGGSKPIHRHLKKAQQQERRWTNCVKLLGNLPRVGRTHAGVIIGEGKWRRFLGRRS